MTTDLLYELQNLQLAVDFNYWIWNIIWVPIPKTFLFSDILALLKEAGCDTRNMVSGRNLASFAAFSLVNVQQTDYVPIFISSYIDTCKIFASLIANFASHSRKLSTDCDTSI